MLELRASSLSSVVVLGCLLALPVPAFALDLLTRPKFQVAIGMGASVDRDAPNPTPDEPVTAFFFTAGLGAGAWGFDLRSFANGAGGLSRVSRLSVDAVPVLRPGAWIARDRSQYGYRLLHAFSIGAGPSFERVSLSKAMGKRWGAVVTTHLDLPIGPPDAKELRLRVGVRRMFGSQVSFDTVQVNDTTLEVFGQLAFVF